MGAAVNGLALHGGIVKPYCSTFFVFTDYMRPPIRLSALMKLGAVWIFSHDSVAVGEDGPTHQPVEHLAAMRAIPNLTVIRPADANECSEAWATILDELRGPICLVLSRQNVPILDRSVLAPASGLRRGAYVLADADSPDVVLVATGAEVGTALGARELLAEGGIQARVVSMPSWELLDAQPADYREEVLPAGVLKISVEAASTFGWAAYVDDSIGIDRFGASGKGDKVLEHLGISPAAVAERVRSKVAALAPS
jgi:transketolase